MADMQTSVVISAEIEGLKSGMAAAATAVQQGSAAMRAQLAAIGAAAQQAQTQFAAAYGEIGSATSRLAYAGRVPTAGGGEAYRAFVADERLQLEAARGNRDQIEAIYDEWLARAAALYGEDSAQYKRVLVQKAAAERQATQQMFAAAESDFSARRAIDGAYLSAFKSDMTALVAAHKISKEQAYGFDIQYTARLHDAERRRLEELMADDRLTVADKTRVYQQLLELDARYTQQVEADIARIAQAQQQSARRWTQMFDQIGHSFTGAMAGLIEGTETWRRAMASVFDAILRAFLDLIGKMIANWLASGLASMLGVGASGGLGAVLGTALSKALPIFDKGGIVPSAAGGWIVPSLGSGGTLAMLHAQEMVLPAGISQGLQNLIAGGGAGTLNVSVSAIDARSVAQFFASNKDLLARTLAQASRGFNPALAGARP